MKYETSKIMKIYYNYPATTMEYHKHIAPPTRFHQAANEVE